MEKDTQKTVEALKKAKQAAEQANEALENAVLELDEEALDQVSGGGEFDNIPSTDEHPYEPEIGDRV